MSLGGWKIQFRCDIADAQITFDLIPNPSKDYLRLFKSVFMIKIRLELQACTAPYSPRLTISFKMNIFEWLLY